MTDYINLIAAISTALASQTPVFLVYLAGIIMAVIKRHEQGRNAILLIVILLSMGLIETLSTTLSILMPILMQQWDYSVQTTAMALGGMSFTVSIFMAVMWGLLIYLFLVKSQPKVAS